MKANETFKPGTYLIENNKGHREFFTVTKVTDKTVTVKPMDMNKAVRRKIIHAHGNTFIFPYGQYSMATILRPEHLQWAADREEIYTPELRLVK